MYLLTGGIDLGLVSVRRFSKPFLVLLVLVGVRAAIPRASWLTRRIGGGGLGRRAARARLEARSTWAPAALDALAAVLSVHVLTKGTAFLANLLFGSGPPAALPDAVRVGEFRGDVRGLGLRLVLRHRAARLLLERQRPEQPRVLSALPAADAGAGLAVRRR